MTYARTATALATVLAAMTLGAPAALADDSTVPPVCAEVTLARVEADQTASGAVQCPDAVRFESVDAAAHGTAAVTPEGTLSFTPDVGYQGLDSFSYRGIDDQERESEPATVHVRVGNTAPHCDPLDLTAHAAALGETPAPLTAIAACTDDEHDALTLVRLTPGALGGQLLELTYQPAAGFVGRDDFDFTATDGETISEPAHATVTLTNRVPACEDTTAAPVQSGGTVTVPLICADGDGDPLKVTPVEQPAHGEVHVADDGNSAIYTPDAGYEGSDRFRFAADDGRLGGTSRPATVDLTVTAASTQPTGGDSSGSGGSSSSAGGGAVPADTGAQAPDVVSGTAAAVQASTMPAVTALAEPPAEAGAIGTAYMFSYAGTALDLVQRLPKRVGRSGRMRLGRVGPAQCPRGCSVAVYIAAAGRKIAKTKLPVRAGRTTAIRLRLYSHARRALRRHHRLRATIFLAIVDGNRFNTVTVYKRVVFKRR